MALITGGVAGPLAKLSFSGFETKVQDVPYGNLFSYYFVDYARFRLRGMSDAPWYFAGRGGLVTDAKKIFWVNYGYKAIVVNDYTALVNLLTGVVYAGSGIITLSEPVNYVSAASVLEREAAVGACPFDLSFFNVSRPPFNYLNNEDHHQLKDFFFNKTGALFTNVHSSIYYVTTVANKIPEILQTFLADLELGPLMSKDHVYTLFHQTVQRSKDALLGHEIVQNASVEYLMNMLTERVVVRLFASAPQLDLVKYLVDRVEQGSLNCPYTSDNEFTAQLSNPDALDQVRTSISKAFKTLMSTSLAGVNLEMGVDGQMEELITQLVYIFTHHIMIPMRSLFTNIVARFHADPDLQKQVAADVSQFTGVNDDAFWASLADTPPKDIGSPRTAFVNEVLRVHPPQPLIFFRATQAFCVETGDGGVYRVNAGDRIIGNLHSAQRDNAVFGQPQSKHSPHGPRCDEFDITRFMDPSSTGLHNKLLYRGTFPHRESTKTDHTCPAQNFMFPVLVLFTSLLSLCSFKLKAQPYWSGYRPNGLPDVPPEFESFAYTAIPLTAPVPVEQPLEQPVPVEPQ